MTPFERAIDVLGGEAYVDSIVRNAGKWGIDTPLRQCHWLAQMAHESGGFVYVRELWGPTAAQKRYEGRLDLGNTQPGDGMRFRGRGFIQVTGRANYQECSLALFGDERLLFNPELLEFDPAASAGWYWQSRRINRFADKDDVLAVSRAINLGSAKSKARPNGMDDRIRCFNLARKAMEAAFRNETNATH